jgi:ATP-dependent Lhr-like helicase
VRSTPIALLPRRNASLWGSQNGGAGPTQLTSNAQVVVDFIHENGALFFDELVEGTRLLRIQVEDALAELVALGIVTSDSFGGLRALLVPSSLRRPVTGGRRRRRSSAFGMENAGRWALARRQGHKLEADSVEHIARTLLHRYGVVFWRLLEREAIWLPSWRDLLRVYRRLEARGEIRGGRFVSGFSGEQFALAEAVSRLRALRRQGDTATWISVSGADPLNIVGIIVPGPKLPALTGNRVLYRDGIAIALLVGGEIQFLEELDGASAWEASNALRRSPIPKAFMHLS